MIDVNGFLEPILEQSVCMNNLYWIKKLLCVDYNRTHYKKYIIDGGGELLFRGVAGLGTGLVDKAAVKMFGKLWSNVKNPNLLSMIKFTATNMLGEPLEEAIQSTADVYAQHSTYNPDATLDWGQIVYI